MLIKNLAPDATVYRLGDHILPNVMVIWPRTSSIYASKYFFNSVLQSLERVFRSVKSITPLWKHIVRLYGGFVIRTLMLHIVFNTLNGSARSFNGPVDSSLASFDWVGLATRIEDQSCVSRQYLDKVCEKILCLL